MHHHTLLIFDFHDFNYPDTYLSRIYFYFNMAEDFESPALATAMRVLKVRSHANTPSCNKFAPTFSRLLRRKSHGGVDRRELPSPS